MAIKTFTSGEVLTAADTNTYLANSGLVLVKQITVGTGVSSLLVSDCFSSTYDNYRVVWRVNSQSTTANFVMAINGSTGANYYTSGLYMAPGSTTINGYQISAGYSIVVGVYQGAISSASGSFDIWSPNIATRTFCNTTSGGPSYFWWGGGQIADTNQSTNLILGCSAGTVTGGIVTVYGYRKA